MRTRPRGAGGGRPTSSGERGRSEPIASSDASPGTTQDEKVMHARFGHLWERGEYFLADPELVEYAESIGNSA